MPKIRILPQEKLIEVKEDINLRDQLIEKGFFIKSSCGGCASCAHCVIVIKEGQDKLNEISFEEKQLLGNVFHITGERLSCQTFAKGNLTVDISMHEKPKPKPKTIRKSAEQKEKEIEERKQDRKVKEGGFKKPQQFNYEEEEKK